MQYEFSLIHMSNTLESLDTMYSIICLQASRLSVTLNGTRCYLDGKYMLCLSQEDTLVVDGGQYEVKNLHFLPYFYNVNLNHNVIGLSMYDEMRSQYGYPDFHLFRQRDASYNGIISLNNDEYEMVRRDFLLAEKHIDEHSTNGIWSCNTRSDMISILRIAESAFQGETVQGSSEILRYIREHVGEQITLTSLCQRFHTNRTSLARLIKSETGMTPMQYVMEERLNQSRPELLFTLVSIQNLAERYGFTDENYYIRAFKKRFGQTPLQYRIEGCAERIRNESIYHQREKEIMKVTEFEHYLKEGLGRGLLFLRNEVDKTPYRQTLLEYYTKSRFFARAISIYDAELIRCFPDADMLAAKIAVTLYDDLKRGMKIQTIPLLVELGYRDTVIAIVELLYNNSYAELLEFTKRGDSGGKLLDCATLYVAAVAALGYLQVDRERMKRAMIDIADLYRYTPNPVVPNKGTWFSVENSYGCKKTKALLEEVAMEHPYGQKMLERHKVGLVSMQPKYAVTAEQIFEAYKKDPPFDMDIHIAFAHATDDVILSVAEEILREEDMDRRLYLMWFFCDPMPFFSAPKFPLDPTPLIETAKKLHPVSYAEDRRENYKAVTYYTFIEKIHHPEVRGIGLKILDDKSVDFLIRECAAKMVFGANFEAEDVPAFIEYLKCATHQEINHVSILALDMGMDIPDEVLEYVFELSGVDRISFVRKLLENGRLSGALREECRFDSNIYIRELVAEHGDCSIG